MLLGSFWHNSVKGYVKEFSSIIVVSTIAPKYQSYTKHACTVLKCRIVKLLRACLFTMTICILLLL